MQLSCNWEIGLLDWKLPSPGAYWGATGKMTRDWSHNSAVWHLHDKVLVLAGGNVRTRPPWRRWGLRCWTICQQATEEVSNTIKSGCALICNLMSSRLSRSWYRPADRELWPKCFIINHVTRNFSNILGGSIYNSGFSGESRSPTLSARFILTLGP